MSKRINALADRLEQGARALAAFASALTEAAPRAGASAVTAVIAGASL